MPSVSEPAIDVLLVREGELTSTNDFTQWSSIKISRELTRLVGTFCEGRAISCNTIKFSTHPSNSNKIATLTTFYEFVAKYSIRPGTGPRDYTWGKIYSNSLFFVATRKLMSSYKKTMMVSYLLRGYAEERVGHLLGSLGLSLRETICQKRFSV